MRSQRSETNHDGDSFRSPYNESQYRAIGPFNPALLLGEKAVDAEYLDTPSTSDDDVVGVRLVLVVHPLEFRTLDIYFYC